MSTTVEQLRSAIAEKPFGMACIALAVMGCEVRIGKPRVGFDRASRRTSPTGRPFPSTVVEFELTFGDFRSTFHVDRDDGCNDGNLRSGLGQMIEDLCELLETPSAASR